MKFRPGQVTFCKFLTIFVFFGQNIGIQNLQYYMYSW